MSNINKSSLGKQKIEIYRTAFDKHIMPLIRTFKETLDKLIKIAPENRNEELVEFLKKCITDSGDGEINKFFRRRVDIEEFISMIKFDEETLGNVEMTEIEKESIPDAENDNSYRTGNMNRDCKKGREVVEEEIKPPAEWELSLMSLGPYKQGLQEYKCVLDQVHKEFFTTIVNKLKETEKNIKEDTEYENAKIAWKNILKNEELQEDYNPFSRSIQRQRVIKKKGGVVKIENV